MLSITNVLIFAEYLQYKPHFALAHFPCSSAPLPMFCFITTDIGAHKPRLLSPFVMNLETALLGLNNALWFCFSCHTLICVKKVYWLYQSGDVCTRIIVHFLFKSLPVHHLWYDLCISWQWNYFHCHCHLSLSLSLSLSNGNIFRVTGHLCGIFTAGPSVTVMSVIHRSPAV